MRICGVGWRASIALRDGGGDTRVLAALSSSIYVEAANELLWIGAADATPHARAVHVAGAAAHAAHVKAGDRLRLPPATGIRPWRPDPAPTTVAGAAAMRWASRVSWRSPRQSLALRAASACGYSVG